MHDGFGWWPLGGLIWLLLIGLAVVGVIARGEIDREEYQRRRNIVG